MSTPRCKRSAKSRCTWGSVARREREKVIFEESHPRKGEL